MTDITRFRGDTAADEVTVQTAAGVAIDITGFSFLMTVSTIENPPDANSQLYQITGSITNTAGGVVEFVPSGANADQIPADYYYDIQMTDTAGRIKTIAKGKYSYTQDITK
jgi:hypothetical protein